MNDNQYCYSFNNKYLFWSLKIFGLLFIISFIIIFIYYYHKSLNNIKHKDKLSLSTNLP